MPCQICQDLLKSYDRHKRKAINGQGEQEVYSLRRLRCSSCKRLHLELPWFLIPYCFLSASQVVRSAIPVNAISTGLMMITRPSSLVRGGKKPNRSGKVELERSTLSPSKPIRIMSWLASSPMLAYRARIFGSEMNSIV